MAKTLLGEIAIPLGGCMRTLRPSFGALYELEGLTGQTGPTLLAQIKTLPIETLRAVVAECMTGIMPEVSDAEIDRLRPALQRLLLHGLGYLADPGEALIDTSRLNIKPLDWRSLYLTVTGVLGRSEKEFWRMTQIGLLLTLEGVSRQRGIEPAQEPMTSGQLRAMLARFPDAADSTLGLDSNPPNE